jgi:hypothetical protein
MKQPRASGSRIPPLKVINPQPPLDFLLLVEQRFLRRGRVALIVADFSSRGESFTAGLLAMADLS